MKETLRLSLSLALTCAVAATVLALANRQTAEARAAADTRERRTALGLVLPEFANDPLADAIPRDGVTFYPARDADGRLVAVAGEGVGQGFGGDVSVLVGLAADGEVLTVLVTKHSETPGLGTQATDRSEKRYIWSVFASREDEGGLPPSTYLDQYSGKAAGVVGGGDFAVVGNRDMLNEASVLAVSGATVSSRAVGQAVAAVCGAFDRARDDIVQ